MHDVAVSAWCAETATYNGNPVPNIVSSPRRAFSDYRTILERVGQLDPSVPISDMPLPFISIERGTMSINQSIMAPTARINLGKCDPEGKTRGEARMFTPIFLPYKISVWCKEIKEQAWITDSIIRRFHGLYDYTPVVNPEPWGVFNVPMKFTNVSDASTLDGGSEDRIIRSVLDITLEGRLYYAPEEIPIKSIVYSFGTYDGVKDLQTSTCEELSPDYNIIKIVEFNSDGTFSLTDPEG